MKQPVFGAVADDLTGGVELASILVQRGIRAHVAIDPDGPLDPEADAVVFALKSRLAPRDLAVAQSLAAVDRLLAARTRQIFFKYCATFDSTPDGNIGPVAEAMLERLGGDFAIFCPAFCEAGRTVYQGHLFCGDRLVSDSPKRFDPMTPMTDPDLVRVLAAQSRRKTGLVRHEDVREGVEGIRSRIGALRHAGIGLALVDAICEDDLATIAESCMDLRLTTGNSSICAYFPMLWRQRGWLSDMAKPARIPAVDGPAAILAGSVAERTDEQLRDFERHGHPVLRIDMAEAFGEPAAASRAFEWAAPLLAHGPVAIATTAPLGVVAEAQRRFGRVEVAARAEAILSAVAIDLVKRARVSRLVIAGGETSGAVLRALGIFGLQVGPYQGPGISRVATRDAAPIALVLKSGKLGPVDMFSRVIDEMRRPIEQPLPVN